MKDCEPRDWPHLPDSRANERPHWIIPHNAPGTKAQQLTQERESDEEGRGAREREGIQWDEEGLQTVKAQCRSHTQLTSIHKTKAYWTGISLFSLSLLRLFSAPPSLAVALSLPLVLTLSVRRI